MVVSFRRLGLWSAKRSARFWVKEDVQRLDPSRLDLDNIRAGNDGSAARRSCLPSQPSKSVMTDGNSNWGKHDLGRQASDQCFDCAAYRVSACKYAVRLVQFGVGCVEFLKCGTPTANVPFAKDPSYIGSHQRVEIDGLFQVGLPGCAGVGASAFCDGARRPVLLGGKIAVPNSIVLAFNFETRCC
jgi:hypothetical protein